VTDDKEAVVADWMLVVAAAAVVVVVVVEVRVRASRMPETSEEDPPAPPSAA
jgi:zinc transporter ZupT